MGFSTPWPPKFTNTAIHRVEIRRVGLPFRRCDEVGKKGPCTPPALFLLCGLECNPVEVSIAGGQSGDGPKEPPRRPGCHGSKFFASFYLIDVNQMGLTGGANSCQNHHGLRSLAVLDDSKYAGRRVAPAPVSLMIVGLFDDEYLDTWSGFEAAKTASWPSRGLHHCGKFLEPSDE